MDAGRREDEKMVKLKATTKAKAMAALEKVIDEYNRELTEMKDSEERWTAKGERDALQALLWSMENIAEDRTV